MWSEERRRKHIERMKGNQYLKGYKHTKKAKKKMAAASTGKLHTEEFKRNLSLRNIGNEYGKGHIKSKRERENLSEKMRSFWSSIRSITARTKARQHCIEMNRKGRRETGIEKKIKKFLEETKIIFEQEKSFYGVRDVDFYLPLHNLVIECDGDYFHSKPGVKERDLRQDKILKQNGVKVLRLPEHEINRQIEKCEAKIIKMIRR